MHFDGVPQVKFVAAYQCYALAAHAAEASASELWHVMQRCALFMTGVVLHFGVCPPPDLLGAGS